MTFDRFQTLLSSSKEYRMDDEGHLEITNYRTGEMVILNLDLLDEATFEELQEIEKDDWEDEEEEEWDDWED